jgi:hypothetical protein
MQALPTLEDVARRAGTSVTTAGRALGGYGKVAPATSKRVPLRRPASSNYYAHAVARSMKQRSSLKIGLLVQRSNPRPVALYFSFHGRTRRSLPTRIQHELLRISQEAISDAVRHAKPTVLSVTLRWEPPNLILQVKDNGS